MAGDPSLFAAVTEREVTRLARRIFLTFGLSVSIVGSLLVGWMVLTQPLPRYRSMGWVMLIVVAAWVAAALIARRGHVRLAIGFALACAIGGIGASAFALQTGVQAPVLSLLPMVIMLAGVLSTMRFAAFVAALAGAPSSASTCSRPTASSTGSGLRPRQCRCTCCWPSCSHWPRACWVRCCCRACWCAP